MFGFLWQQRGSGQCLVGGRCRKVGTSEKQGETIADDVFTGGLPASVASGLQPRLFLKVSLDCLVHYS